MQIICLYTAEDNKSYFKEIDSVMGSKEALGMYSAANPVKELYFRDFTGGEEFPWHNAPREQYIIYLAGEVEVRASGGEQRIFKPGDVLLVTDVQGEGHYTKTLSSGRSIIVTVA
jgi:uncharacterized cupin superfamily protein